MAKTSSNGPFCARTPQNFYLTHFIDLKLFASFLINFSFSASIHLTCLLHSVFHSAIIFEKFTARIFRLLNEVARSNSAKTSQNGPFFACTSTSHNFYHMHFVDLKLVAPFFLNFPFCGKHPLDMPYCNSTFHSEFVFEKFTARMFKKSASVII